MPPQEMSQWIDQPFRPDLDRVVSHLNGGPFGIIAPVSGDVPSWHRVWDAECGWYEKLFVWADAHGRGPLADLYRYMREIRAFDSATLTLIATSGNLHGLQNFTSCHSP